MIGGVDQQVFLVVIMQVESDPVEGSPVSDVLDGDVPVALLGYQLHKCLPQQAAGADHPGIEFLFNCFHFPLLIILKENQSLHLLLLFYQHIVAKSTLY